MIVLLIGLGIAVYATLVGRFLRSMLSEEVRAGNAQPSEPPRSIPRVRCDLPPSVALPAVSGTGSRSRDASPGRNGRRPELSGRRS